ADASWPHARGACALVRANAEARSRLRSRRDGRLAARRGPGLRVAARRARVGQSEPECAESLDGTLLRRNGDGRGHDLVRGPRHDAAARTLRRTGYRHTSIARRDAKALSFMDEGLHPAGVLVRADFPQARRQAVRGHPNTRRSRSLRARGISSVAFASTCLQGAAQLAARLSALARFPL